MIPLIFTALISIQNLYASEIDFSDENFLYLSDGQVIPKTAQNQFIPKIKKNNPTSINYKSDFSPTVLTNKNQLQMIFNNMREDYKEGSQCTNMAHVWAYEEYQRTGLKSEKIFIFFTKKYIKRYRFNWWFHVAPLMTLTENGNLEKIVLDRAYTTMPFDIKTWTEHFVKSKKRCKFIKNISTYYKNKSQEDCFLMKVSMYFWQPRDIRLLEESGKNKKNFSKSDISQAYKEAFNRKRLSFN